MRQALFILVLTIHFAAAQAKPATARGASGNASAGDDLFPPRHPSGNVGLLRGILIRIDSIHDQLVIRAFGGGDTRVGFDVGTQFPDNHADAHLPSIPPGSLVSVDTMVEDGKLFAVSVKTDAPRLAELNGQVIGFDPTRSRLTLRDPISPENISLEVTSATTVMNGPQASSVQALTPGTLVRVWFPVGQRSASQVEVVAKPGSVFAFEGRILSVDLRLRLLMLSNDSDQSLRELSFEGLSAANVSLLRPENNVAIQAEFDGQRYNVRSVALLPQNP